MTIGGAALVLIGADKLTDGAVDLARRFGISEMVIGLTIVAFGTSLPEFVVSLMACFNNSPAMSIGNIVGSNIFNTLMITGATAIVLPITVAPTTTQRDIPLCLLASLAFAALTLDPIFGQSGSEAMLTRGDGVVLLCFFIIFMAYTFSMARPSAAGQESENTSQPTLSGIAVTLYIVLGLAGLIAGGEFFVRGASGIARACGVSDAVIGLTLVAGGTSLPELATSIIAARKGQSGLAIGNVIGSNLFNIFWILGACSLVRPLPAEGITWVDLSMLVAASVVFWLFAFTDRRIARWEGFVLVTMFASYMIWLMR